MSDITGIGGRSNKTARSPPNKFVNLKEYLKETSPEAKIMSPVKVNPAEVVESKKARRARMKAEAKKYEESKREEKRRAEGGQTSSDDDDKVVRNSNLLKRPISSSESEGEDNTSKKIKNVNKSYEDKPEETGVEAEEMETIEKGEAAAEVEGNDGRAAVQEQSAESINLIQFDDNSQTEPINEEIEASVPETEGNNNIVFIKGRNKNITDIKPARVKQRIEELAGEVEQIVKSRDCLKVTCKSVRRQTTADGSQNNPWT